MRSQDDPGDVYIQDVMRQQRRRQGIASAMLRQVVDQAARWKCRRVYLTSDAQNSAAAQTWRRLGFRNIPGDKEVNGVQVISDYKGPDKDRALFQLDLG